MISVLSRLERIIRTIWKRQEEENQIYIKKIVGIMKTKIKCRYCYDKGYSTVLTVRHVSADFEGDREYNTTVEIKKACRLCAKGKKLIFKKGYE